MPHRNHREGRRRGSQKRAGSRTVPAENHVRTAGGPCWVPCPQLPPAHRQPRYGCGTEHGVGGRPASPRHSTMDPWERHFRALEDSSQHSSPSPAQMSCAAWYSAASPARWLRQRERSSASFCLVPAPPGITSSSPCFPLVPGRSLWGQAAPRGLCERTRSMAQLDCRGQ